MKIVYINLDRRPDRRAQMEEELARVGLEAVRIPAIEPGDYKGDPKHVQVMWDAHQSGKGQSGALGNHLSHVCVADLAAKSNKPFMVLEDDAIFCTDFKARLARIEKFLAQEEWDIFWLGGTYYKDMAYWHGTGHPNMPQCSCALGVDWEYTDYPSIVRTYGCWCVYAYIINPKSAVRIKGLLEQYAPISRAVDWLYILIQPQLRTFAFTPGCVKQRDGVSDVSPGFHQFSIYEKLLGPHWFKDML